MAEHSLPQHLKFFSPGVCLELMQTSCVQMARTSSIKNESWFQGFRRVPGISNTPRIISPVGRCHSTWSAWTFSLPCVPAYFFYIPFVVIQRILERKCRERKVVRWTLIRGMLQARCQKVGSNCPNCMMPPTMAFPAKRVSGKHRQARNSFWKG